MIRILLDECLPVKLKYRYQEVQTVTERGWTGVKNGDLLDKAQQEFDVFITIDQNISYQQDLTKYSLAVVALKAQSNRYEDLLAFVKASSDAIKNAKEGTYSAI